MCRQQERRTRAGVREARALRPPVSGRRRTAASAAGGASRPRTRPGPVAGRGRSSTGVPALTFSSTSKPCACSWSSWSLVTVRVERLPGGRSTWRCGLHLLAGDGDGQRPARVEVAGAASTVGDVDDDVVALVASLPAGAPEAGLVASPCPPPAEDGRLAAAGDQGAEPHRGRASRAQVDLSGCRSMRASLGRHAPGRSSETMERVPDRLTSLDASFLYLEEPTTAMHVGSVDGVPAAGATASTTTGWSRSSRRGSPSCPRYRQQVREVPGRLANPVWVDDEDFDVTYHVRRSAPAAAGHRRAAAGVRRPDPAAAAGPRPARCGRSTSSRGWSTAASRSSPRPTRPSSTAINAVDIAHVIVDATRAAEELVTDTWRPAHGAERRRAARRCASSTPCDARAGRRQRARRRRRRPGTSARGCCGRRSRGCRRWPARPPGRRPTSPLNVEIGAARRWVMVGDRPRRLPQGARAAGAGATPTTSRSTTWSSRRSPGRCAPGC